MGIKLLNFIPAEVANDGNSITNDPDEGIHAWRGDDFLGQGNNAWPLSTNHAGVLDFISTGGNNGYYEFYHGATRFARSMYLADGVDSPLQEAGKTKALMLVAQAYDLEDIGTSTHFWGLDGHGASIFIPAESMSVPPDGGFPGYDFERGKVYLLVQSRTVGNEEPGENILYDIAEADYEVGILMYFVREIGTISELERTQRYTSAIIAETSRADDRVHFTAVIPNQGKVSVSVPENPAGRYYPESNGQRWADTNYVATAMYEMSTVPSNIVTLVEEQGTLWATDQFSLTAGLSGGTSVETRIITSVLFGGSWAGFDSVLPGMQLIDNDQLNGETLIRTWQQYISGTEGNGLPVGQPYMATAVSIAGTGQPESWLGTGVEIGGVRYSTDDYGISCNIDGFVAENGTGNAEWTWVTERDNTVLFDEAGNDVRTVYNYEGVQEKYTLNVGQLVPGSPILDGYQDTPGITYGGILPMNTLRGTKIGYIQYNHNLGVSGRLRLMLEKLDCPQDTFISLSVNGDVYLSADAIFGGEQNTLWEWEVADTPFTISPDGVTYDNTATFVLPEVAASSNSAQWVLNETGGLYQVNRAWIAVWDDAGIPDGTFNKRMILWLESLGYTGNLTKMSADWRADNLT